MAVYCAESDVTPLTNGEVIPEDVTRAIEVASRIVDAYTGRTFSPQTTPGSVTIYDADGVDVLLPEPFEDITEVRVNGTELDPDSWEELPWGIRLHWMQRSLYSPRYGATIEVDATFGFNAVPTDVKYATALIAEHVLNDQESRPVASSDAEGNATLPEFSSENRSVSPTMAFNQSALANNVETTGVLDADRILAPYRIVQVA